MPRYIFSIKAGFNYFTIRIENLLLENMCMTDYIATYIYIGFNFAYICNCFKTYVARLTY